MKKKIAVILPIAYGGGSLRGACLLAEALLLGSRNNKEPVNIIFAHLEDETLYGEEFRNSLPEGIMTRTYRWSSLKSKDAKKAMSHAGYKDWQPEFKKYAVFDDDMNFLADCDLWLIISDRVPLPLLPLKPYVLMVYDYIQRYIPAVCIDDSVSLKAARQAQAVLTTTKFTQSDALQYAGVSEQKVRKVPMLVPQFHKNGTKTDSKKSGNYFVWTTNLGTHKNHANAFKALKHYYEQLNGTLDCYVTGVNTQELSSSASFKALFDNDLALQKKMKFHGNLSDEIYCDMLSASTFLWHTALVDNGTFSVIEANQLGVPSLSSDYPAMREMNELFKLNLAWMNPKDPLNMAEQLKWMEESHNKYSKHISGEIKEHYVDNKANEYWKVLRECM